MSKSLAEYQVDHLFLLMGKNPLPNYVAARTLLREGGTPYFVHTKDTAESAERLRQILRNDLSQIKTAQLISLEDYECDSYYIQRQIRSKAELIKNERVGLNYTGGTKAMSVHAYRAILKAHPDAIFSYLDPRRLEMCIDREDGERIRRRVSLELKLGRVIQLHGLTWSHEPAYQPQLPEAAREFAKFQADQSTAQAWRIWCNSVLRPETKNNGKWLKEAKLRNASPLALKDLPSSVKNALQKFFCATETELSLQLAQENRFKEVKHVCEWLHGEWLEHYILQLLKEISRDWSIHESATSFWIREPRDPNSTKFQFDVAFMRGYQLFALSCTTSDDKELCKNKLFEAYLRARELGGDEARVALVCCSDKPDALKAKIEVALENRKIPVFGRGDLADLSDKISQWIEQSVEEAQ